MDLQLPPPAAAALPAGQILVTLIGHPLSLCPADPSAQAYTCIMDLQLPPPAACC
eukprot:CAMPEP_0202365024 /NCGR_PEP_ID=MMETSP1126-20121109/16193_1 /ASSEMBLY_ACC=CAM_ASM_000457 /TAXON_ID=3047 /ORGANISM="Dunaliella tertiolecta, Strain CCMP1320" /LENGTH=54 /DNA_ID=CAMNT_0048959775 /DNA_START=547 /DNA_END=709 /DNA_ORIENTATION=-